MWRDARGVQRTHTCLGWQQPVRMPPHTGGLPGAINQMGSQSSTKRPQVAAGQHALHA